MKVLYYSDVMRTRVLTKVRVEVLLASNNLD